MSDCAETWKPVLDYEGLYEVSNTGKLRSLHKGEPRELRQTQENTGYLSVGLYKDTLKVTRSVHSLVAEAFIGPRPQGHHVCHVDGRKTNNAVDNLIIASPKTNALHKLAHGTAQKGEKHPNARFTEEDVRAIRARYVHRCRTNGATAIAIDYGASRSAVQWIVYGRTWLGVGQSCDQPIRRRAPNASQSSNG